MIASTSSISSSKSTTFTCRRPLPSVRLQLNQRKPLVVKAAKKEFVGPYTAENKYKCKDSKAAENLRAEWAKREAAMRTLPGFTSFELKEIGGGVFAASQTWDSKAEYEGWMDSDYKRKSHFYGNIYQFSTKDKYSVPEEFMPVTTTD
mmetsp:Transcript_12142/g.16550  ORF Transcript_12142/g.16550 Transcript_12142/m.16550 type:complete len:148 (+) Transcript_12142:121-564(+)|eukprot:CAMPEP_0196571666 /NCGR_PEP_ID=MMETSP1081-20130531/1814_1 /TAXON_ID=36882 /ORGANISM="Pyramimonas amylifera, Strain CCMP720" /LENGTH=147 /DNA_ID=CAMNT_0041888699 /DNA_START=105 /DNA_END=548 /DNA_ORIENTATION=+